MVGVFSESDFDSTFFMISDNIKELAVYCV